MELEINRTDTSANVLTLDGISKYNTNDTSPVWADHLIPSPSNYRAASKFQITSTTPIDGNALAGSCRNGITIQGFRLIATEGQVANLAYLGNLVFQYVEGSRNAGGTYGPGLYAGPANGGPGCGGNGPAHVQLLNNYIHDTWGECVYIGASTPDPPGNGNAATGDDYLVQGNTLESCATAGGQGDGIDVKDGHTNLRLIGNTIRPTLAGGTAGNDGQGVAFESGAVIDGNYIEAPGHDCISITEGWNNTVGRSALTVGNNICVNIASGVGHNNGIELQSPETGVTALWTSIGVYNNTIYETNDACISFGPGNAANVGSVENNIASTCGGGGLSGGAGTLMLHDYNDFFAITGSAVSYGASVACTAVAGSEAHSVCADPKFASTTTPYSPTGFEIAAGSAAMGAGTNLFSMCNGQPPNGLGSLCSDFNGTARPAAGAWDIGAFDFSTHPPLPDGGGDDAGVPGQDAGPSGDSGSFDAGPSGGDDGAVSNVEGGPSAESPSSSGGCGCRMAGASHRFALLFGIVIAALGRLRRRK